MSVLSPSQQPTILFSIYQNNTWTIRRLVNETIDPGNQRIILKIVGFVHNGFQPIVDIASICKSVCRGMNYGHVSKSGFPCLEGRKMSEHTSLAHVPHRIFSLWHLTLTQDDT